MSDNNLHITNGSSLTDYLTKINFKGDTLTWHEMLCEGPTVKEINTPDFFKTRKTFLEDVYDLEYDIDSIKNEFNKLDDVSKYTAIVLWFEYDLFCHINLIAAISLIKQKGIELPLYLVCSGRIAGEKDLKVLSDLSEQQLLNEYENKIKLNVDDIATAQKAWRIYCEHDHNLLKELIVRPSSFKYLSNCLKAHLRRFPDTRSGLNTLEYNTLILIKEHTVTSRNHLLGYCLHYQGYYGFGDLQLERMINRLELFFDETENTLTLNRNGHLAIEHQKNFSKQIDTEFQFGGVNKKDFQYDKKENKLIPTI
ncbi:DUF1835 domain-containing protein [Psychroserpens sp. NJDZ02]|uniref:DUF1835 domain-containing protein n=1 Tax=Psychroserpens sp. NJDZ02 TaxID=2570561 RepID=UPI0010A8EF5D|nr:DUF1835 domain-containing protein [Psychroserpens sp. NJDZ02]QCE43016.1 DUF1835 domain-containing protein [Psychroserpens sp. NJDZ02]